VQSGGDELQLEAPSSLFPKGDLGLQIRPDQ